MCSSIRSLLTEFVVNPGVTEEQLLTIEHEIGFEFPTDYRDFLRYSNGADGQLGEGYLSLWKAEELIDYNEFLELEKYMPGLFFFGSDGGGEGFGFFDVQSSAIGIIQAPFIGLAPEYVDRVADNFIDFLQKLRDSDGWLLG